MVFSVLTFHSDDDSLNSCPGSPGSPEASWLSPSVASPVARHGCIGVISAFVELRLQESLRDEGAAEEELHDNGYYPPASDDEVWRLANIAKDGSSHKRLNEAGIYTVGEFLRQLSMDSKKPRNILGRGMTDKKYKKWEVLQDHARICTLNRKLYVYHHDNQSDHGVIFDNVGQLIGLTANGVFCAIDRFSLQQKDHADRLVKKAYENWNDVRRFDVEAPSSSISEKISCSFLSEVLGDQQCSHPVHGNMAPPRLASQVGLKVPPRTSASTVEGTCSKWLSGQEKAAYN